MSLFYNISQVQFIAADARLDHWVGHVSAHN